MTVHLRVISSPTKAFPAFVLRLLASPARVAIMTKTCLIRHEIDPFNKYKFTVCAENWVRIIPRLVGNLLGYFVQQKPCAPKAAWDKVSS
jgi:hypothetical protein